MHHVTDKGFHLLPTPSFSLRSQLALLILAIVLLLSLLLSSLISHESVRRLHTEIGQDMADLSMQMVDRLDRDMANRAAYLQVLGSLKTLREPNDPEQIQDLLNRLVEQLPSIAWIGFTDPQGTLMAASGGLLNGMSIAQRPVYMFGRDKLFIGDVHEAVLLATLLPNPSGEAMKFVDISLPVYAYDGSLAGVLAAHLSWGWAKAVSQELLAPTERQSNVEFLILSHDHTVLLGPAEMIGQPLVLPGLQRATEAKGYWDEEHWPDGQDYLTAFASSRGYHDYAGLGWIVVARQALDEAYAPARSLSQKIIILGIALAIVFALLGWFLASYISRPLQRITSAADRLSAGLEAVIPELQSPREVASLSRSIRQLVTSLSHHQSALGEMDNQAHSDPLTGLANRAALERFIRKAPPLNTGLVLLYLDLDGFKPVNDTYGHAAGDQLLKHIAVRLRGCVREGDLLVRLGGDEFAMLLPVNPQEAAERARQVAERVLASLNEPVQLEGSEVKIGCSIGGALWPQDGENLETVLKLADAALYQAKRGGRNRAQFHEHGAQA